MSVSSTEAATVSKRPLPEAQRAVHLSQIPVKCPKLPQVHAGREECDPWWAGGQLDTMHSEASPGSALSSLNARLCSQVPGPHRPFFTKATAILALNKGLEPMVGCYGGTCRALRPGSGTIFQILLGNPPAQASGIPFPLHEGYPCSPLRGESRSPQALLGLPASALRLRADSWSCQGRSANASQGVSFLLTQRPLKVLSPIYDPHRPPNQSPKSQLSHPAHRVSCTSFPRLGVLH